ncbi:hypothetical protein M2390_003054 [Mycetocola sp. BIGb0189]|uniref:hypothetical protein n=1 Tax=Mycetocola sp. BIGb0189 TaxID=2940604 RepID=UPI002169471A|nr:hypothetical protein [Mycetocola sp. BIGb0189]MCS4277839.1 hypothetical protein [Mycetocola sp. BIGb0189]
MMLSSEYQSLILERFPESEHPRILVQLREVDRFLTLTSTHQRRFIPLTEEADLIWHEMIVQTRRYAAYCEALPSGGFVHHESIGFEDYASEVGVERAVRGLLEWIPEYVHTFGAFTEEAAEHWAILRFLREVVGLDLPAINRLTGDAEHHVPPAAHA